MLILTLININIKNLVIVLIYKGIYNNTQMRQHITRKQQGKYQETAAKHNKVHDGHCIMRLRLIHL